MASLFDLKASRIEGAFGEINGQFAALTDMGLIEFVREDLPFFSAVRALADKG